MVSQQVEAPTGVMMKEPIFEAPADSYAHLSRFEADLLWVDRNFGPRKLWYWWYCGLIPDDEFQRLLPHVWTCAEFPVASLGSRAWLEMFKDAGFVTDCGASRPGGLMTVYRGHDLAHVRGFSWTTDPQRARWFADRFRDRRPPTFVFESTIPPHAVLAIIDGRNESEVVLNPNCLRGSASPHVFLGGIGRAQGPSLAGTRLPHRLHPTRARRR